MAPAALWAALAVGLQLWAAGRAVPTQVLSPPYALEPGSTCQQREYYDKTAQMCCSKCPPGQHAREFCTRTSDTVCAPCESSTYTELWNWVPECLSCGSRCTPDQVEAQACTREQNRICTCKEGWYCTLGRQEGCRLCTPLRRCRPGFGVVKPGTATSDVVCAPCTPGTFSDTTSSSDTCRPHRNCSLVVTPGNASMDTVCRSVAPVLTEAKGPAPTPQPASTKSQHVESSPGPSMAPSSTPLVPMRPSPPVEGLSTGNITLPIGLIVGMTTLGLLVIGLLNCVIVTQKKKKPLICLQREAKVPHLPVEKARPGPEQQHLLTTAPSSSSSSLESSASAADRRAAPGNQQGPGTETASGPGAARASSASSEPSPGGHGTHVNVTCIVNVCSSSDHASQCPSQASSTVGDTDASPSGSPKNEQVPFSKEERPFQSQPDAPETLLQSHEEKPLPLGVPDAGMKPS
ncbi:tumor necrosis factor receptor superfamily member 1B isoform X2 [Choloepus didactylus]|uniref:tumor necrosis factor receptor superfamily member 1B isoform X2 n=1 Tax=Choloepus didactylus TaxID=27675 RepID=UPI00189EB70C|nr:tumor necrosis factor receptor superfamily member 1B isoform X2 [Choloepus didactylus]